MGNLEDFRHVLDAHPQTVTIAVEDPRIKPALVKKIVQELVKSGKLFYFDYDLQYSSYLQNISPGEYSSLISMGLSVFQPNNVGADFVNSFEHPEEFGTGGVFVLDSINSMQAILSENASLRSAKTANYKAAFLVTILQLVARNFSKSVVIFDFTKSRPRPQANGSIVWEKELVGGRMIRYKSDLILFASRGSSLAAERGSTNLVLQESNSDSKDSVYTVQV